MNYETTATGTFRCFIDNREYRHVEDIPDYGDWALLSASPNLDPQAYWKGSDTNLLPSDPTRFSFLKKGVVAITSGGTTFAFNLNNLAWEAL